MKLSRRHALACAIASLLAAGAHAQAFPEHPVTFVVPFAAGSATDQLARALAQGLTQQTGQQVIVDNRAGANGFIGAQYVAKARPDGYTVFITTNTTHAANEHLFKKLPYDPVKDFEPVTLLGRGGQIMVVNDGSPAHSVGDFIKLAKAKPGKLSFGWGSSSSRIAGELFKQMTGTEIASIPYKSNPPALTDLMGGQIDMMITDMATGLPQVKAGKLRALGVSTTRRSPLAPEVPTLSEAGVKGYEMTYWFAAYVPAGTPAPVVGRLNELLAKSVKAPAAATFYGTTGTEALTGTPDELRRFQQAESRKWEHVITAAGIEKE